MRRFIETSASKLAETFRFSIVNGYKDVPLNVAQAGTPGAPAIVFIHGLSQSYLSWIEQMLSDLNEGFHIVAYDLRGHGASGKPWMPDYYTQPDSAAGDLDAVVKAAGLGRFTAVAWSFGGYVLCDYIRVFGTSALERINLVGTLAAMMDRPTGGRASGGFPNMDAMKEQQRRSVSHNPLEVIQSNFGQTDFVTHTALGADLEGLIGLTTNMLPAYVRLAMAGKIAINNRDIPPLITCPLLLSTGDQDWTVPAVSIAQLRREIPTATVSEYPGCGHAPFLENPSRFNAELRAFVSGKT